jgi:tetratricopeptide (TPR) repeat protein
MSHVFLQLWNFLLKRPLLWVLAIVSGIAAGTFSPLIQDITSPVFKSVTQRVCEFRKTDAIPDESRFTILISPLTDDKSNWHTTRVVDALRADRAFRPIVICESLSFDDPADPEAGVEKAIARGAELITQHRADLLIFGKVVSEKNSFELLAINEHGGCERRPKPAVLKQGFLADDFLKDMSGELIAITIGQIASACNAPSDMDWPLFAKRIDKLAVFIERAASILPPDQVWGISQAYSLAMSKLYENGQDEIWFKRGTDFNARLAARSEAENDNVRRFEVWRLQGHLLAARAARTGKKDDQAAAISAYGRAIEVAKRASLRDPERLSEVFSNRGLLYFGSEDQNRAVADFNEAIRLDPKNAASRYNRGNAFNAKGEYNSAVVDYSEAIRLNPAFALAYHGRGSAYYSKDDYDRAIADFGEAIKLEPKLAHAYYGRGDAYKSKDDYDRAIADYSEAVKLDPKLAHAYYGRGNAYNRKREYDRAIADFTEVIRLYPKLAAAYNRRGVAHFGKDLYDDAIADFDEAIRLDSKVAIVHENRGAAYFAKFDYDQAIANYDEAIRLDSASASRYNQRGRAYLGKKDYDRAIADHSNAIRLDPNLADARESRGFAYFKKNDYDRSVADYDAAIRLNPKLAVSFRARALLYLKRGKVDLAIRDYDVAVQIEPKSALGLYGRGLAKTKKGDQGGSNADLAAAKALQPDIAAAFARAYGE